MRARRRLCVLPCPFSFRVSRKEISPWCSNTYPALRWPTRSMARRNGTHGSSNPCSRVSRAFMLMGFTTSRYAHRCSSFEPTARALKRDAGGRSWADLPVGWWADGWDGRARDACAHVRQRVDHAKFTGLSATHPDTRRLQTPAQLRARATALGPKLCAFDWEMAGWGLPQRDVVEFLAFVLPPDADPAAIRHCLDVHRRVFERRVAGGIDVKTWYAGVRSAVADFGVTRLPM